MTSEPPTRLDLRHRWARLYDELAELRDLNRDAGTFEIAERVSHGVASEQAPELELHGTSDAEIDEVLQKFLKRGI